MKKLCRSLDRVLVVLLVALFAALVLMVVWQVLSRYALNSPSAFTEEAARYLMIWVSLLGASYVFRMRLHIGLDLLTRKLTGSNKRIVEVAALTAAVLFALLILLVGGVRLVELTWSLDQVSAVLGIRMALVYLVIPLSGGFILLYTLEQLLYGMDTKGGSRGDISLW